MSFFLWLITRDPCIPSGRFLRVRVSGQDWEPSSGNESPAKDAGVVCEMRKGKKFIVAAVVSLAMSPVSREFLFFFFFRFNGAPYRSTCLLQPTSSALVNATEWVSISYLLLVREKQARGWVFWKLDPYYFLWFSFLVFTYFRHKTYWTNDY